MKTNIIILLIFINISLFSYSQCFQYIEKTKKIEKDIIKLDKRIRKLLKDRYQMLGYKEYNQQLKMIYVYNFKYGDKNFLEKKDLQDTAFLYKLKPVYSIKVYIIKHLLHFVYKRFLSSLVYICDSSGKLIAMSDGYFIYDVFGLREHVYSNDKKIVEAIYKYKIHCIFNIEVTHYGRIYYGIKENNEIIVFVSNSKGFYIYSMKEFLECCWSDYQVKSKKYNE
ncbi:MAG: hypothetical protein KA792_03650 [Bacteroidales bacterium]|nr:hypothetical protein [Bacteroidales bacterium]